MRRTFFQIVLLGAVAFGLCPASPAKEKLGKWYKNDKLDFKVRIPDEWPSLKARSMPEDVKARIFSGNLVDHWYGPRTRVKSKELGSFSFPTSMKILWFESGPVGPVVPEAAQSGGGAGGDEKDMDEKKRKELLKKRREQASARTLEQWLHNYSGLTGVRIIEKEDDRMCNRPAVEYAILSKTDLNVNYKHYAVAVKISDTEELVLMFSVVEEEYKKWKPFFRKVVKTLKIDRPQTPSRKRTSSRGRTGSGPASGRAEAMPVLPDLLITRHGRTVEGRIREEDDFFIVRWGEDSIRVPKTLVRQVDYGDPGLFVPRTEKEKANVAKGYVRFKGRWVSKYRLGIEIEKEKEKRREKIENLTKHSNPANPWRAKRSRFIMETTTNEELLDHYADLVDALFSTYEKTLGIKVSSEAKKNRPIIRIFKDVREYQAFSKLRGTGGYFNWLDNSLNLYHNFEDPSLSERTLLHEGAHLLNYLSNTKLKVKPHWVEEGAAEYFGSACITYDRRGKPEMAPGQILGNRLLLVNQKILSGRVTPLRKALNTKSYKYEDYAYWWSTFHFLMTGDKYKTRFLRFFKNLYSLRGVKTKEIRSKIMAVTPQDSVEFLEKSLKIEDWAALQKEWEEFVQTGVARVGGHGWMVLGRDLYYEALKTKYDTKSKLGKDDRIKAYKELLLQSMEKLDKAVDDLDYRKADAYYYRSLVHKSLENPDSALGDIDRAVGLNPLNAYYYSNRAVLHYTAGIKEPALKNMRIAIALDPLNITFPLILNEMKAGAYVDLGRK